MTLMTSKIRGKKIKEGIQRNVKKQKQKPTTTTE